MKLWIKYLIACVLGIAIGLLTPIGGTLINTLAQAAVNMIRVTYIPLLLFSIPVAAHELHSDKKLLSTIIRTVLYSIAAVFLLTLIGAGGAILFSQTRIPLINESGTMPELPDYQDLLFTFFPLNFFESLSGSGYIIPLVILGLVLGLAFSSEKQASKPVLQLADSLSRIIWQINSFLLEVFPIPFILLSAARISQFKTLDDLEPYIPVFKLLGIEMGLVFVILLPLVLFLGSRRKNPLRFLYAMLAPAMTAFFAADYYAPAGILSRHLKESMGVRRRVGSIAQPLSMILGRPGTAMISASGFIIILNSYSSLGLGPNAFLWILFMVPLSVLLAAAAPTLGPAACIAFLCGLYGKGFESGYLLILPIILPLQALAVLLDTIILGSLSYLVATRQHETIHKETRHYI